MNHIWNGDCHSHSQLANKQQTIDTYSNAVVLTLKVNRESNTRPFNGATQKKTSLQRTPTETWNRAIDEMFGKSSSSSKDHKSHFHSESSRSDNKRNCRTRTTVEQAVQHAKQSYPGATTEQIMEEMQKRIKAGTIRKTSDGMTEWWRVKVIRSVSAWRGGGKRCIAELQNENYSSHDTFLETYSKSRRK